MVLRSAVREMNRPLEDLRNLGPRCVGWLEEIGIFDEEGLRAIGAVGAYRELIVQGVTQPHRMLLYALAGALEDVDCLQLSPERKQEFCEEAEG